MRWSVGAAGWEVERGLPPPAVGGEVEWPLTLVEEGRYEASTPEALVTVLGARSPARFWNSLLVDLRPVR